MIYCLKKITSSYEESATFEQQFSAFLDSKLLPKFYLKICCYVFQTMKHNVKSILILIWIVIIFYSGVEKMNTTNSPKVAENGIFSKQFCCEIFSGEHRLNR